MHATLLMRKFLHLDNQDFALIDAGLVSPAPEWFAPTRHTYQLSGGNILSWHDGYRRRGKVRYFNPG
jgi:hypothetical protein